MTVGAAPALESLLRHVRDDLARVEAELRRMTAEHARPVRGLLDHVARFSGKRLRPVLTLLAGRMFGPLRHEHHTVAAIVEMLHTATLVHDDILDESLLRRGLETVNRQQGNETAVLLGDYLFATAFREAAALENRFPARYLSGIVVQVCRGEILQVHHRCDLDLPEDTYFEIIRGKTAALYAGALRTGAQISGAPDEACSLLERFGMKLGCAFQIVDDILDLAGEETAVGKSLGTDLDKAKMTLPLLRLRGSVDAAERARLDDLILSGEPEARRRILPMLEAHGSLASARATAEDLAAAAVAELDALPDVPERELLRRASSYMLARDR